MRVRREGAALTAVLLLSVGCGGSSGGKGGVAEPAPSGPAATSAAADVTGKTSVDLVTQNYSFEPAVLHGTPGQKLSIHLSNSSGTEHNFTLAAQKVNEDIGSGKDVTVSVTLPSTGQLVFFCEYHVKSGMTGALLTGDAAPSAAPSASETAGY